MIKHPKFLIDDIQSVCALFDTNAGLYLKDNNPLVILLEFLNNLLISVMYVSSVC